VSKIGCTYWETTIQGDRRIGCCGICSHYNIIESNCYIQDKVKEWMLSTNFESEVNLHAKKT